MNFTLREPLDNWESHNRRVLWPAVHAMIYPFLGSIERYDETDYGLERYTDGAWVEHTEHVKFVRALTDREPEELKRARYAIQLALTYAITVHDATRMIKELGRLIWRTAPTVAGQYWVRNLKANGATPSVMFVDPEQHRRNRADWQYAGPIPEPML